MGKTSNYRFSINGMCMLEMAAGKIFAAEICGREKETK